MIPDAAYVLLAQATVPNGEVVVGPLVSPVVGWVVYLVVLAAACTLLWLVSRPWVATRRFRWQRPARTRRTPRVLAEQQA